MLLQGSAQDLITKRIKKSDGYIVIAMKKYPRGVGANLRDEYLKILAPSDELFEDFRKFKTGGSKHEVAFAACDYENRFWLKDEGLENLARLSDVGKTKNVYLICQCKLGEKCHRELLLIMAKKLYGAPVGHVANDYPVFLSRI